MSQPFFSVSSVGLLGMATCIRHHFFFLILLFVALCWERVHGLKGLTHLCPGAYMCMKVPKRCVMNRVQLLASLPYFAKYEAV